MHFIKCWLSPRTTSLNMSILKIADLLKVKCIISSSLQAHLWSTFQTTLLAIFMWFLSGAQVNDLYSISFLSWPSCNPSILLRWWWGRRTRDPNQPQTQTHGRLAAQGDSGAHARGQLLFHLWPSEQVRLYALFFKTTLATEVTKFSTVLGLCLPYDTKMRC